MKQNFNISLLDIKKAAEKLRPILRPTKLIYSDYFSEMAGAQVYLKPENLQVTGAYKIRGAYNKISQLTEKEKAGGLIAASAGNHAQGVAYAARKAKVPATIVMPASTPLIKVDATKKLGARVVLDGDCYDDACNAARKIEKKEKLTFIHPFNDWDVIAGQGTIGLEIMEELPDADYLLVPIGGGGLISGIAIAANAINPKVKVVGVEPFGADAMYRSVKARKLVTLKSVSTIADGVAVKKVSETTLKIVSKLVDGIVRVTDTEIMEAFLVLLERQKLIAEPAGAIACAALFDSKLNLKGKKVVALISGGNIDVLTISALVSRGLIHLGRVFEFSVDLVDRPGELVHVAKILAENKANVIKIVHNQFESVERIKSVRLTITVETNGFEHIKKIKDALKAGGYSVENHKN
ncbi:MAG: threonine ammonia-lyase [Candidatus Berkelbacteria bacterium]|nr:threonine ammonia-lyase [Candidatus Berkelbacteria bacterium]